MTDNTQGSPGGKNPAAAVAEQLLSSGKSRAERKREPVKGLEDDGECTSRYNIFAP
jgi:hypothetical protein